jgi:hypothetical protein
VDTAGGGGRNLNKAAYSAETETWKAETEVTAQKLRTKGDAERPGNAGKADAELSKLKMGQQRGLIQTDSSRQFGF